MVGCAVDLFLHDPPITNVVRLCTELMVWNQKNKAHRAIRHGRQGRQFTR